MSATHHASRQEVIPDPTGELCVHLGKRYGNTDQRVPADNADRVILVMSIEHLTVCCEEITKILGITFPQI